MDLPKELLQKHLPRKQQGSEKAQATSGACGVTPARPSRVQGKNKPALPDVLAADDEGALFVEAMRDMVHRPRTAKKTASHGAFPLAMPAPVAAATAPQATVVAKPICEPACASEQRTIPTPPTLPTPPAPHNGSPEPDDAFALAMRTVQPLKGKGRDIPPPVVTVDASAAQSHALSALLDSEIVFDVHVSGENVQGQVVGLDPKVLTSLISGSQSPEARLDLHGMNAAQAFQALIPFFRSAWHKGLRTVIVVTGRGINSPSGVAVLRQKLTSWLTQDPFRRVVLAFSTAQACDGGTGSIYVLLRKFRKKHPVYWERTPVDPDVF